MGESTLIAWADSTWNPWEGCTRCSPGCANCYAAERDARNLTKTGSHWGKGAPRRITAESGWQKPVTWNRKCQEQGTRLRVFGCDLCDWCDEEAPEGILMRFWELIRSTPYLDWLLLTKRAERISALLPEDWGSGYPNVWLGVTVENRAQGLPRIDILRDVPAVCRFLSVEPLLEDLGELDLTGISWAIIGGESGHKARTFRVEWAQSILRQCREQGTVPFIKQLGAQPTFLDRIIHLKDNHGGNWEEWPISLNDLKVREFPLIDGGSATTDQVQQHANYLKHIESDLAELASSLDATAAEAERPLRARYLENERRLFLNRREKGAILAAFKTIYVPIQRWSDFLRRIGMPRQTAYDLVRSFEESRIDLCGPEEGCTDSVQDPADGKEFEYVFDQVVARGARVLNRVLTPLSGPQRQQAIDAILDRISASETLKLAA